MPLPRRILLKLSGEMMTAPGTSGLDDDAINRLADELVSVVRLGVQTAVVLGGGNLFRGIGPNRSSLQIQQQSKDTMGMLATCMNMLALDDRLRQKGLLVEHQCSLTGIPLTQALSATEADRALNAGSIVLFSGGTGLPFLSTDTAAVMRALQVRADALYKGTQVDGVYDRDPRRHPDATFLERVTAAEALRQGLAFMDSAALALARQHGLEVVVFKGHEPGNLARAISGELRCSRVIPNEETKP